MFAVWSPLVCQGPTYPSWARAPSPLATQPGREGMHARKQSTAKHSLCNRVGSSPAERGSPCVFSAYCSQLLFHASPPSSCFAWDRKTLWKFLAASPFFLLSLHLPSSLCKLQLKASWTFPNFSVLSPTNVSLPFYPSQHCIANSYQSDAVYQTSVGSLQRVFLKWQALPQPATQPWQQGCTGH